MGDIRANSCPNEQNRSSIGENVASIYVLPLTSVAHAIQVERVRSGVTHHRPCCLLAFSSMPPLLALLAFLARAWHGAPSPRHARFVAFDGGRCHRTPPRGALYTGQPVTVVIE